MKTRGTLLVAGLIFLLFFLLIPPGYSAEEITQGTLQIVDKEGKITSECPLKHTSVKADISGFISRVTVTQEFHNPSKETVEAVYTFPLPQNSAVDDMTMKIGDRVIKGIIKKKEEAKKIYDEAKQQGKTASLLEQERPNIFTQSVANITPGSTILVEISYVETLSYNDGIYEFVFPMVVGPRYMPGNPTGQTGTGWSPDTDKVPDASRISPPVVKPGSRSGHDISVEVNLNAGVPVKNIQSVLHKITVKRDDKNPAKAKITLNQNDNIPNKDFILQYETSGDKIQDALLTYKKGENGYFTFILQPPAKPQVSDITPKEMFFVLDASGSQMGWPIEKAKETMWYCIENMNPEDTFQVLSFANEVRPCFDKPQPNTKENRELAQQWLATQLGNGGTEMMKAIDYSLGQPADPKRMRIVVFMTDGYVGNDMAILDAIKKNLGTARLFPFGTGNSVNRYLLEGMAAMGKGEVEWVTLNRHGDEVAEAFQEKIGNPLLLDVEIDWGNAPVSDLYPKRIPDLFSGKPIIIKGKYDKAYKGEITLKGLSCNKPYSRKIKIDMPEIAPDNDVLGVLWARIKIEDLMNQDLTGIQQGKPNKEIEDAITKLGLEFRLMTQFTSFVAVEEKIVNEGGVQKTVVVPVEMPQGVSYEGVFGRDGEREEDVKVKRKVSPAPMYHKTDVTTNGLGSGGGSSSVPTWPSVNAPTKPSGQASAGKTYVSMESDWDDGYGDSSAPVNPQDKLADSLKGLKEKVEKEGTNNNYKNSELEVKDGKIELIITVTHVSKTMLKVLKEKGFIVDTFSIEKIVLKGTTSVANIEELVKLDCVTRIEPVPPTSSATSEEKQSLKDLDNSMKSLCKAFLSIMKLN